MTDRQKALADAILSGTVTARPEAPRRAGCVGRGADMAASRAVKSVAVQSYMAGQIAVKHGYARGLADQSLALVGRGVARAAAGFWDDPGPPAPHARTPPRGSAVDGHRDRARVCACALDSGRGHGHGPRPLAPGDPPS